MINEILLTLKLLVTELICILNFFLVICFRFFILYFIKRNLKTVFRVRCFKFGHCQLDMYGHVNNHKYTK